MPLATYFKHAAIDYFLRPAAPAPARPATVVVALLTTAPAADGTGGTEVTGGGYARVAATLSTPTAGTTTNSAVVQYPAATAAWGTVTHVKLMDALAAGNTLAWAVLPGPRQIVVGNTPAFDIGDLDFDLNRTT